MARNGSGTYSLPAGDWNPPVSGATIDSAGYVTQSQDLASALTQSISKDGQTTWTGDDNHGGFKITNLANGILATDAATVGQLATLSGVYAVLSAPNLFTAAQSIRSTLTVSGSVAIVGSGSFVLNCTTSGNTPARFTTISANGLAGPNVQLYRSNSASAGDLLGSISIAGNNSTGTLAEYGGVYGAIVTTTAGSERGRIYISTRLAGANAARFYVGAGLYSASASGGDMGEGTINVASGFYVNGQPINSSTKCFIGTYTANTNLSSVIPYDDSIPQKTEGTQIISLNVVTTTATQRVQLTFSSFCTMDSSGEVVGAIFQGSASDAIQAAAVRLGVNTWPDPTSFVIPPVDVLIGSATTTAFAVRVGPTTGNCRFNGTASARLFGGIAAATLTAIVYEP